MGIFRIEMGRRVEKTGLRRGVYLSALLAVCAFIATVVVVVNVASHEANRFALNAQINTLRAEFDRQLAETIQQQAEISQWDEAVRQLVLSSEPDEDFVENELVEWIVADFGFSDLALIGADGAVRLGITGGAVMRDGYGLALVGGNGDLVSLAREKYRAARDKPTVNKSPQTSSRSGLSAIEATAIRRIGAQTGYVTAQVMVPDSSEVGVNADQETVLLTFKPITDAMMVEMAGRLEFFEPRIVPADAVSDDRPAYVLLATPDVPASLALIWRPNAPRGGILKAVVPLAGGLCLVICLVLGLIVRRHAQTLRDLAASEAKNRFMANHDGLTGLANRKRFDEELNRLVARSPEQPFAVLCADLDRFKAVNDDYGHPAGDAVLQAIAERFSTVIGDKGLVARFGGDEFAAILTGDISFEELNWIGDSLVEAASRPIGFEGQSLSVGASVGMAAASASNRSARTIMAAADKALYCAKRAGRGRISVAAPVSPGHATALQVA